MARTAKTADSRYYATGRRKSSVARVWLKEPGPGILINGRDIVDYLHRDNLCVLVRQPLETVNLDARFAVQCTVRGGGVSGQAGAIRLGIARALLVYDENLRPQLRRGGFLTRDPRKKERKKFGRKGARKRFQYTKR